MPCACCMLRTTHTCDKGVHTHVRSTCMLHALGTYKARFARLVRPIGPRYACACNMCMQPSSTTQDHHTNGPRHARPVCPYSGRGAADLTSKHIARVSITPWHQRLPKSGRRPHTRPPAHLGATKPKSRPSAIPVSAQAQTGASGHTFDPCSYVVSTCHTHVQSARARCT